MQTIYVDAVPEETRLAIKADGQLQLVELERPAHAHLVGNIYKGQVQNVLPGMQAAFVDIGTGKNAFLHVGDGMPQDVLHVLPEKTHIHVGQYLPVQVVKDATGTKGPRVSTHISLPGRHLVLMPTVSYIGISRRITDEVERTRLQVVAQRICPPQMGLIVRTVAEGLAEAELAADVQYLVRLWQSIMARFRLKSRGGVLLYRDADLIIRAVRDYLSEDVEAMLINDAALYARVRELVQTLSPALLPRIRHYTDTTPLFRAAGIEPELEKLGARQVELPSGGFLVIDKTEAMTVIDVNTGRYVGRDTLAATVYQTNLEAAREIMQQIRLRDISGIIIVDFIDMETDAQKEGLLQALRALIPMDRTKVKVVDITSLGLVEITRKKTRANYASLVYSDCPVCHGLGRVESPETMAIRISRAIRRMEQASHAQEGYEVEVHATVAEELRQSQLLVNLAAEYGTDIKVTVRPDMHPENYSILQQG